MVRLTGSMTRSGTLRAGGVLGLAFAGTVALAAAGWADQPHNWQLGFQPSATPVHDRITAFHDGLWPPGLMVIITLITIFVLGLLLYTMVKFHHARHPVPTRVTHNTLIEVLWTIVPVLILVLIAIPSFKLMYYMDRVPDAAMTIKVTGHQWYWSYEYPDQKIGFDSNMVEDKDLKPGQPRLLTVDNPLVVPANTNVRVLITSTDVIHSWFIPSFGVQEYAIIGRANESWFNVERPGAYDGECNQICGINHSHMPIQVVAMAKPDFEKWLGDAKKKFALAPAPTPTLPRNAGEGRVGGARVAAAGDARPAGN